MIQFKVYTLLQRHCTEHPNKSLQISFRSPASLLKGIVSHDLIYAPLLQVRQWFTE